MNAVQWKLRSGDCRLLSLMWIVKNVDSRKIIKESGQKDGIYNAESSWRIEMNISGEEILKERGIWHRYNTK